MFSSTLSLVAHLGSLSLRLPGAFHSSAWPGGLPQGIPTSEMEPVQLVHLQRSEAWPQEPGCCMGGVSSGHQVDLRTWPWLEEIRLLGKEGAAPGRPPGDGLAL